MNRSRNAAVLAVLNPDTAEELRSRARVTRAAAEKMISQENRETLLRIAANYEQLANSKATAR